MKCSAYQNGVLRYSRDGAAAVDRDGNEMWNGSYDMENPALDICEEYAVVADIQGKSLYVYNGSDSGTKLTTDYPILQACVSKQGVVAVLLEDQSSNVIQVYNPYDDNKKLLVEIPTNVEEGYPVSIDLSPDGTGVICASICVTSGAVKSQVAFYDFTDVGKNTNCLVGAQEYKDRIVAEVKYLDEDHAALFSEKGFSLWKNMKKPKQVFNMTERILYDYNWYVLIYDHEMNQMALVFLYSDDVIVYNGHVLQTTETYDESIRPCILKLKEENQEKLKSGEATQRRVTIP